MSSIIKINKVTKIYDNKVILDNVDFEIKKGEIFGIIGESGSGKSTLLKTIVGFLKPDKGDIMFKPLHLFETADDVEFISLNKNRESAKKIFGYAAQEPSIYEKLTVKENLELFGSMFNLSTYEIKVNSNTLVKLVGLNDSEKVKAQNLSGGMLKRLDIGCSMMHDPKILLLDEPTADLDPLLRNQIWELLRKINERGTTIIISSHLLDTMESFCHRIGIIKNGKLVKIGTPNEVKGDIGKNMKIELETISQNYDKVIKEIEKSSYVTLTTVKMNKLSVYTKNIEDTLHKLIHTLSDENEHIVDIKVNKPNLDGMFEKLVDE